MKFEIKIWNINLPLLRTSLLFFKKKCLFMSFKYYQYKLKGLMLMVVGNTM